MQELSEVYCMLFIVNVCIYLDTFQKYFVPSRLPIEIVIVRNSEGLL